MNKETAERAKLILEELDILNDILDATDKEESHWWGFLSPDVKRWHSEGIRFPESFCPIFVEAVKKTIKQLEDELKTL